MADAAESRPVAAADRVWSILSAAVRAISETFDFTSPARVEKSSRTPSKGSVATPPGDPLLFGIRLPLPLRLLRSGALQMPSTRGFIVEAHRLSRRSYRMAW